jgi:prenylcysteine oxidase / farnesylcysteine lyase
VALEIVLFEQKPRVGGRMVLNPSFQRKGLLTNVYAEDIASGAIGGSVLRERARGLGIKYGEAGQDGSAKEVGFFDGRELVARLTRPRSELGWAEWFYLVWRYGLSFVHAKDLPTGTMASFEKLLKLQRPHESVESMVKAAELGGVVGRSASERLRINGIGGNYVGEVLSPEVRRQFGQNVEELSDLAISMALEREDLVLGSDGGSFEVMMAKFVDRSKARLQLGTKVIGLKRELVSEGKEGWVLELQRGKEKSYEVFDHVILAGPWNTSSLHLGHARLEEVYYRSVWVTFLISSKELNGEYFGTSDDMPPQILPIPSANLPSELHGIHEISFVGDVFGPDISTDSVRKLYRLLSDQPITKEAFLAFGEGAVLQSYQERIGNAYPLMWPRTGSFGEFNVHEGLWHTGVMEAIGSSVDLSWVAGENVGKLVARNLGGTWKPTVGRNESARPVIVGKMDQQTEADD